MGTAAAAWRSIAKELSIEPDYPLGEVRAAAHGFSSAAEQEVEALAERGAVTAADEAFCASMLERARSWHEHVSALPMMRSYRPTRHSPPADAAKTAQSAVSPRTTVQCGQRLRGGALCNRRLRDAPCPLHPSSPGSRQIRVRR